jgi:hypothetical protein
MVGWIVTKTNTIRSDMNYILMCRYADVQIIEICKCADVQIISGYYHLHIRTFVIGTSFLFGLHFLEQQKYLIQFIYFNSVQAFL